MLIYVLPWGQACIGLGAFYLITFFMYILSYNTYNYKKKNIKIVYLYIKICMLNVDKYEFL